MTIFFLKFVGGKKIKQKECYDEVKKLFKHFVQSADFIDFTREYGIKGWKELDKWLEQNVK